MRKLAVSTFGAAAIAASAFLPSSAVHAASTIVTVSGSDNPFLAGQAAGVCYNANDCAPGQSPTLALTGFDVSQALVFTYLSGGFGTNGAFTTGPDGFGGGASMTSQALGIAGSAFIRPAALVGVFMGDGVNTGPAPAQNSTSIDSPTFSPLLHQIFFIGDGRYGPTPGTPQQFFAPAGATRLFLGSADLGTNGGNWYDNAGTMSVSIDYLPTVIAPGVPEPTTWAMLILGFGAIGVALRRRKRFALQYG